MSDFTPLREAVDALATRRPSPDFGELRRRATRRGRRRVVMVAAATAAVIAGSVLATTGLDDDRRTAPAEQPKPVVVAVPVWYDAKGLHRGDVVEHTPVELVEPARVVGPDQIQPERGALALVRSGAVYLDPATGDVWFHPWGGDPRIVGQNSAAGPGGDPNGDTAAWFEGPDPWDRTARGELVVYDTAAGREISRTLQSGVVEHIGQDHRPPGGNSFLQVSAERVVWTSGLETYNHEVATRTTSVVPFYDVHDYVEVFGYPDTVVIRVSGRAEKRYPDLEGFRRLSPSGNYVLAVEDTEERRGAVTVDTNTGELWRVPNNTFPEIAWSYGDIAMVDAEDEVLACDATRRACQRLPVERPFLMPTN